MADIRLIQVPTDGPAEFEIEGRASLRAEGTLHLAQVVVNHLLTTPGSDALSPTRGAGLSDLTRRHRTNSKELREKIASRVDELTTEMKSEQQQLDLPPSETLESMTVDNIERSPDTPDRLDIYISIRSASDQDIQLQL